MVLHNKISIKKNIAILLVVAMIMTMIPVTVYAEGNNKTGEIQFYQVSEHSEKAVTEIGVKAGDVFSLKAQMTTGSALTTTSAIWYVNDTVVSEDSDMIVEIGSLQQNGAATIYWQKVDFQFDTIDTEQMIKVAFYDGTTLVAENYIMVRFLQSDDSAILDIGDGNIVITDSGYYIEQTNKPMLVSAVETSDKIIKTDGNYTITGVSDTNTIIVESGIQNITIKDLDISSGNAAPLAIEPGATVNLILAGENKLTARGTHAGIQVVRDTKGIAATLNILGDGSLQAIGGKQSAGIGGNSAHVFDKSLKNGKDYCDNGIVVISSGEIYAEGTDGGAGIGGGSKNWDSDGSYKNKMTSGGDITIQGDATVIAYGGNGNGGAGIGGGSHGDGGNITIAENVSVEAYGGNGGAGIGSGTGSHQQDNNGAKGPGYYHGGNITIAGGNISAYGGWEAAGIGGGYCADSGNIIINDGVVYAYGHIGNENANYQGGAGIGGGYEGHANVTINGGSVYAIAESSDGTMNAAAGIGSGATPNSSKLNTIRGKKARGEEASLEKTTVVINNGTIVANGGAAGGAGIGSGFGADQCEITITGGNIDATGGLRSETDKLGGAGIGSGCESTTVHEKYHYPTDLYIAIYGNPIITATGGWGASGIGSGAQNNTAKIDFSELKQDSSIHAYADGTKFAIDTLQNELTTDAADGVIQMNHDDFIGIATDYETIYQGTFTNPEGNPYGGLNGEIVYDNAYISNDGQRDHRHIVAGEMAATFALPEQYRSFAVTVPKADTYLVRAADKMNQEYYYFGMQIADKTVKDLQDETHAENQNMLYQFDVTTEQMSDNCWLYPIKLYNYQIQPYYWLYRTNEETWKLETTGAMVNQVSVVNHISLNDNDIHTYANGYRYWLEEDVPESVTLENHNQTTLTDLSAAGTEQIMFINYIREYGEETPVPDPEPTPDPIPDPNPTPVVPPSGGENGTDDRYDGPYSDVDVDIPDQTVPLAEPAVENTDLEETIVQIDEPNVPLTEVPGTIAEDIESITIEEPEVPLADVPLTGDEAPISAFVGLLLAAGMGLLVVRKKFNKNE